MAECPNVKRDLVPNPLFNVPMTYKRLDGVGGEYVYYQHDDGFGKITNVQFCQRIGRVRDVFRCLNPSEWSQCPHSGG